MSILVYAIITPINAIEKPISVLIIIGRTFPLAAFPAVSLFLFTKRSAPSAIYISASTSVYKLLVRLRTISAIPDGPLYISNTENTQPTIILLEESSNPTPLLLIM